MHLHFVNDILCMCWWWEHNVRKKTVKTYLHTFQNGGYLKSVVSTSTETSGQMKIVIDIKPFCKCHRELKNILLIKIGHKKPIYGYFQWEIVYPCFILALSMDKMKNYCTQV